MKQITTWRALAEYVGPILVRLGLDKAAEDVEVAARDGNDSDCQIDLRAALTIDTLAQMDSRESGTILNVWRQLMKP